MFKRVLITLDGSNSSEVVLPQAAQLLQGAGAEVHLLTVAKEPEATAASPRGEPLMIGVPAPGAVVQVTAPATVETKAQAMGRITEETRDFLIARAALLDRVGVRYKPVVRFGEPAEEILRYAERERMDLIVMATHGHTALARLVFGSVASRVVASGLCPVLLVRPDGLRSEQG